MRGPPVTLERAFCLPLTCRQEYEAGFRWPEGQTMEPWKSESSPGKQSLLGVACTLVGVALAIGFRDFRGHGGDALAGFLLGLFLLGLGVAGILASGKQVVIVDPGTRRIDISDSPRVGAGRRSIPFGDIAGVSVGSLGKRSNGVIMYYLALKLRNGSRFVLLPPGRFFKGSDDRSVVEGWKDRLERYLAR